MYTQIKLYVCAIKITHIIVCIHSYNNSYNCLFTKYKWLRKTLKLF